jgi:threonine dehydrogenase-like Zn-dependent dehydrogenase
VGLFAIASAFILGAERVIAIDRFPERLRKAREHCKAETLNYEDVDVLEALREMTGGRGPDACIDAVGMVWPRPLCRLRQGEAEPAMRTDRPRRCAKRFMLAQWRHACHSGVPRRFPRQRCLSVRS